jgi:aminoglycoside 2'-N-acetyltransferase I
LTAAPELRTDEKIAVQVLHTADLGPAVRAAARALVVGAFADEVTGQDWDHALGGIHALAWEGESLVGHAAVVQRSMLHQGRPLRCGYIEAVAVRRDRRRRGIASRLMAELERIVKAAYDLGALGATDAGAALYRARGWTLLRGPSSVLTPNGIERTPIEDGSIYVLEAGIPLDPDAELTCDSRAGDAW